MKAFCPYDIFDPPPSYDYTTHIDEGEKNDPPSDFYVKSKNSSKNMTKDSYHEFYSTKPNNQIFKPLDTRNGSSLCEERVRLDDSEFKDEFCLEDIVIPFFVIVVCISCLIVRRIHKSPKHVIACLSTTQLAEEPI